MKNLDFIYKRHSVRKFKDCEVPTEDIKEIIKAATYSATGKNLQHWHYVVIKNKDKIIELADVVEKEHFRLLDEINDENIKKNFGKYRKFQTIFKYAPVVILAYAGEYPTTGLDVLEDIGARDQVINELLQSNSGMQTMGASIENLLLAAANTGYGGCWITGANFASRVIDDYIKFDKEGCFLTAIVTLGVPEESELKSPKRKPLDEILTIIE